MSEVKELWELGKLRGASDERERILHFVRNRICFDHKNGCDHSACYAMTELVELIKGEQK